MKFFLSIGLFWVLQSCSVDSALPVREWMAYLNDPGNGLVKQKHINNFILEAKYLPPDYFSYKNRGLINLLAKGDSIKTGYDGILAVLFTIKPDTARGNRNDIMYYKVFSEEDFKQRVHDMNFEIKNCFHLNVGHESFAPLEHQFENTYELSDSRKMIVFFNRALVDKTMGGENKHIDFVYTDQIFDTGVSHFLFSLEDIGGVPKIQAPLPEE